ncbi:MFS transporter, partial [Singulisphaera rosea]
MKHSRPHVQADREPPALGNFMADAPVPSTSVRSRTFAALDNPDYRRYYIGQGISLIGTWLQAAAVNWLVFERTNSESWLGIVAAVSLLPGLLVGLIAGEFADRFAPRKMILVMEVGQMALAFALAALVGFDIIEVPILILILALTRICVTFEMPSRQVFLFEIVGRADLTNAIALNSGLFNASRVLGPALAGFFYASFGPTTCFVINGASYLGALAALLMISGGHTRAAAGNKGPGTGFGGIAYLWHDRK